MANLENENLLNEEDWLTDDEDNTDANDDNLVVRIQSLLRFKIQA